jgi:putative addiction module component (TIGR02574 family)
MTNATFDRLIEEALTLSPFYRAMLAEQLLNSLDQREPEIESAWVEEVKARVEEIDQNKVALIPAEEVLDQLRNR